MVKITEPKVEETLVATDTVEPVVAKPKPKPIKLTKPFGFVDEAGHAYHWMAGRIIEDAAEIELLIKRGAHYI